MKTFKGLFIDNCVIKAGEFPEYPEFSCSSRFCPIHHDDCECDLIGYEHEEALVSAKANAVECEDQTLAATLMNGVRAPYAGNNFIFPLPSGWDYRVEESVSATYDTDLTTGESTIHSATRKVAKLYRTDGQIKLDRLGNTSSPVIQTEESQEDMWTDVLHITKSYDTDSFYNTVRTLMKHFTITRKP